MTLQNHILAHLTKSKNATSVLVIDDEIKFTDKEKNLIEYLGGYVFSTFYRRIRYSKSWQTRFCQETLSILLAGKIVENDSNPFDEYNHDTNKKFTSLKNQGSLWSISSDALSLFKIAEVAFRKSTKILSKNIDCSKMTADLLQDVGVLSHFSKICNVSSTKVSKVMSLNLLDHLLTLLWKTK
jgi:hypothetical protein